MRRSIIVTALPATSTSVERQTERAYLISLAVKVWRDDITDEPETIQREVWFPKSMVHYISTSNRYGIVPHFLQTKEEEIAKQLNAKRVGIVVENDMSIYTTT